MSQTFGGIAKSFREADDDEPQAENPQHAATLSAQRRSSTVGQLGGFQARSNGVAALSNVAVAAMGRKKLSIAPAQPKSRWTSVRIGLGMAGVSEQKGTAKTIVAPETAERSLFFTPPDLGLNLTPDFKAPALSTELQSGKTTHLFFEPAVDEEGTNANPSQTALHRASVTAARRQSVNGLFSAIKYTDSSASVNFTDVVEENSSKFDGTRPSLMLKRFLHHDLFALTIMVVILCNR